MSFFYSRSIYLSDTDAAGVVYFANIIQICHEAYEQSLANAGVEIQSFLKNSSVSLPIIEVTANFFQPIFCGDKLLVKLMTKQLSDREFEIIYHLFNISSPDKIVAKATTKHVCINILDRTRSNLPDSILHWLVFDRES